MTDTKNIPSKDEQVVPKIPEKMSDYNIEIVRDFDGVVDPFYLSQKDPNYEYRFLRDEHKNLSIKTTNILFQKGGWQICGKEHLMRLGLKEKELSPDGLMRRGDCILAFMPKKLYQEKQEFKVKEANAPMKAVKRLVEKGDHMAGAGIHETMRGIQTKKELGM